MQTEHGTRSVWPLLIASAVAVVGLCSLVVVDHGIWNRLNPSPHVEAHAKVLPSAGAER
jgi:hypothetical protein